MDDSITNHPNETTVFYILKYPNISTNEIEEYLSVQGYKLLDGGNHSIIGVVAKYENIIDLIEYPWLLWIEEFSQFSPMSSTSGILTGSKFLREGTLNLTGKNVKIGMWEATDWEDTSSVPEYHFDYLDRLYVRSDSSQGLHATNVAGILTGTGLMDRRLVGMAPDAKLFARTVEDDNRIIYTGTNSLINSDSLNVTNHSYGYPEINCFFTGHYSLVSRIIDSLSYIAPTITHVYSAGNFGDICGNSSYGTISVSTGAAKNNIVVGAITKNMDIWKDLEWFSRSSWGPARDGRLKPELVAIGSQFATTLYEDTLTYKSGTSFSAPIVTGTIAQLYELYQNEYNAYPYSSLIKAVLCNTAQDLGNPGPDFAYGYGKINAVKAAETILDNRFINDTVEIYSTDSHSIQVNNGVTELKVMLAWLDYWTSPINADTIVSSLVNDLDLYVVTPSNDTILPWVLDPANRYNHAIRARDTLNNVEQVTIQNPEPGQYMIYVSGDRIKQGTLQSYSLTWEKPQPQLKLRTPLDNEILSFRFPHTYTYTPVGKRTYINITWDADGEFSKFMLELQFKNSNDWHVIVDSIEGNQLNYRWEYDWFINSPEDTLDAGYDDVTIRLTAITSELDTLIDYATGLTFLGTPIETIYEFNYNPCENEISFKYLIYNSENPRYASNATEHRILHLNQNELKWEEVSSINRIDTFVSGNWNSISYHFNAPDSVGTHYYSVYSLLDSIKGKRWHTGSVNIYEPDDQNLWIRNSSLDDGTQPDNNTGVNLWSSDDIWVRQEDDGFVFQEHQNPVYRAISNDPNYVYVRVRNQSDKKACGVLKLYWAKASTGLDWPDHWFNYWEHVGIDSVLTGNIIGEINLQSIPGNQDTIFEFTWVPPNPSDFTHYGSDSIHFCLLARIETEETYPFGMTYAEKNNTWRNVKENNKIAWKNVTVIRDEFGKRGGLIVRNTFPNEGVLSFNFEALPTEGSNVTFLDTGRIYIYVDEVLMNKWIEGGSMGTGVIVLDDNKLEVIENNAWIENIILNEQDMCSMDFEFDYENFSQTDVKYYFNVIQYMDYTTPYGNDTTILAGGVTFNIDIPEIQGLFKMPYQTFIEQSKSKTSGQTLIDVYPNPVNESKLNITINSQSTSYSLILYDILGRLIHDFSDKIDSANAINYITLNLDNISSGFYLLKYIDGNNSQNVIIIVSK